MDSSQTPPRVDRYHEILKKYWGYDAFRPLQEDIIRSVGAGRDTLALMPTGGGKSLTFQVPTLAMDGLCLVVTPLIALMKDQVDNLRRRGIKATAVYMGMTTTEIDTQLDNCIFVGAVSINAKLLRSATTSSSTSLPNASPRSAS